jgi:hypothetical protein
MGRGIGVGIEAVAGYSEKSIAGILCVMLAEFVGSGDEVKDG